MNNPTNGGHRARHRRRWTATGLLVGVPAIVVPYLLFAQEDSQAATVDGDAYYRLVSVRRGKVLGIAGNSTAQGAAEQQTDSSATSQEWQISEVSGSDAATLTSRRSGQVLDISGGSAAQGAAIVQYPRFRHLPDTLLSRNNLSQPSMNAGTRPTPSEIVGLERAVHESFAGYSKAPAVPGPPRLHGPARRPEAQASAAYLADAWVRRRTRRIAPQREVELSS